MSNIEYILKLLHEKKIFEISLAGGEPFLHPDILEILSLCCEKYNFATIITTNTTLLKTSFIKKLAKFKNLAFVVSLEGFGEINDMIRGKGVFKKVDQVIKTLKENNLYVEISCTLTEKNISHYQDLLKYCNSLDVFCNFNLFKPFKRNHNSYILKPEKYFKFVEDVFKLKNFYKIGVPNAGAIFAYLEGQKYCDECYAINCAFTIDVEGNMVPCPALQTAGYYNKIKLPKFDENFINTWKNNHWLQRFRKGNLQECQVRSLIFSKDINGKDPYGINAFKKYQKTKRVS